MAMVVVMVIVKVRVMVIVITGKRPNAVRPGARGAWTQLEQAWWIDEKRKSNCPFAAFAFCSSLCKRNTFDSWSFVLNFSISFFTFNLFLIPLAMEMANCSFLLIKSASFGEDSATDAEAKHDAPWTGSTIAKHLATAFANTGCANTSVVQPSIYM